ncbi:MAG: hypothetical protein ACP5HM_12195 [Anaerolineae bacterium]
MRRTIHLVFNLQRDAVFLRFLLILALVHGLLYIFIVPPWQHYDEPGRFEYAWLIANRPGFPMPGDEDPGMRRELLDSMIAHDFFEYQNLSAISPLIASDLSWIGFSQLGHRFGYYSLVALPLHLLRHVDLTTQLYIGRLFSLLLYLATVWIAWRLLGDLVGRRGQIFRRMTGLVLVLLPSFADTMSMVGNDVGAVFVFSFFLWGCIRLLRYGISPFRLFWVLCTMIFSVLTKNTLALAPLWGFLALIFVLVRKPLLAWGSILGVGLLCLGAGFSWGDAALWERHTTQLSATSTPVAEAPLGTRALFLAVDDMESSHNASLKQFLPYAQVEALQGQDVTMMAWIWASQPISVELPTLVGEQHRESVRVLIDTVPTLHVFTETIRVDTDQIGIVLHAPVVERESKDSIMLYYDGVGLFSGTHMVDMLTGAEGNQIRAEYDKVLPTNYVRNGSAEQTWFRVRSWFEDPFRQYVGRLPLQLSPFLTSVFDWERTRWVYAPVLGNLFQTFWAAFGWGNVRLPSYVYKTLLVVTAFGLVGAMKYAFTCMRRDLSQFMQRSLWVLFVSGSAMWIQTILRVHPIYGRDFFNPGARYAYPAIIPTVLVLTGGWLSWGGAKYREKISWVISFLMILLALFAIFRNIAFYYT